MIWHKRSSSAYIKYLRKKGIHIGEHCIIRAPRTARIDVSRPSLVTIGNNVDMNMNFQKEKAGCTCRSSGVCAEYSKTF